MRRGQTAKLTFGVNIPFESIRCVRILITQGNKTRIFEDAQVTRLADRFEINLSQEDTLALSEGILQMQVRATDDRGNAYASNIMVTNVERTLDNEVITCKK